MIFFLRHPSSESAFDIGATRVHAAAIFYTHLIGDKFIREHREARVRACIKARGIKSGKDEMETRAHRKFPRCAQVV